VPDVNACRAQTKTCVTHGVDPDSPDRGVAVMEVGAPAGGAARFVLGLKADGTWGYWFGSQQATYHALTLPAEMRVCADGQSVNVRETASETASSRGMLKDGALVTADRFMLTNPGTYGGPGPSGNGWYSITGATPGFVRADLLSVTTQPDCKLRDALQAR
jgi:hypothetical protein